jgi:hypothetical protein
VSSKSKDGLRPTLAALRFRVGQLVRRPADDVWGMILIVVSLLIWLSFLGLAGPAGAAMQSALHLLFGAWRYAVPVAAAAVGVGLIAGKREDGAKTVAGAFTVFIGSLALFHLLTGSLSLATSIDLVKTRGGAAGALIAFPLRRLFGYWGAFLILAAVVAGGVLIVARTSVREMAIGVSDLVYRVTGFARSLRTPRPAPIAVPSRAKHLAPSMSGPNRRPSPSRRYQDLPTQAATSFLRLSSWP